MARKKVGRVNIFIDMTPMVDVTMLLLTFFMLTTQFRPPTEAEITLPSSNSIIKLPESDVMTITITKDDHIYLGLDSQRLRAQLFGEGNALAGEIQVQKMDQLADLVMQARTLNPRLRTVIKGDQGAPYGPVQDVMDVLQRVRVTRFNLVTDLEKS
jgi:biopolymer transport protein ExbD